MDLNIKDKVITLTFGLKFIKNLEDLYSKEVENKKLDPNQAISIAYQRLSVYEPNTVFNVIKAAQYNSNDKATDKEIEEFLEVTDIEELVDDFLQQLATAPMLKGVVKLIKKDWEYVQKVQEEILKKQFQE